MQYHLHALRSMGDLMGRYDNTSRNQYNSTPRKVFDKYVDRMDIKLLREKEAHRSDIGTLVRTIRKLEKELRLVEEQLNELRDHVAQHCLQLDEDRGQPPAVSRDS